MTSQAPLVVSDRYLRKASDMGYRVHLSQELLDPVWDSFLAKTPTARHHQSSLWGQVKMEAGWRPARLLAWQDSEIVGGAQMLVRSIPAVGRAAYISRGPVFASTDPVLLDLFIHELHQAARQLNLQMLIVQPPYQGEAIAERLPLHGFKPSSITVAPRATVLVDLSREPEEVLSRMTTRTRQYLRSAQRRGITIKEGRSEDVPAFYEMLSDAANRKKWSIYKERYYTEMWRILSPGQNARLTFAQREDTVMGALLAYAHGEAVYAKTVFSVDPNDNNSGISELLVWDSLQWAKGQGHRYYDYGRVQETLARDYVAGRRTLGSLNHRNALYKLRLGGEIVFCPPAYYYLYSPTIRWAYERIYPKVEDWPAVKWLTTRLRGYGF